jgi:hypothetical protein
VARGFSPSAARARKLLPVWKKFIRGGNFRRRPRKKGFPTGKSFLTFLDGLGVDTAPVRISNSECLPRNTVKNFDGFGPGRLFRHVRRSCPLARSHDRALRARTRRPSSRQGDARQPARRKAGQGWRKGNLTGGALRTPPVKEKTLEDYGIDKNLAKRMRKAGKLTPAEKAGDCNRLSPWFLDQGTKASRRRRF